MNQKEKITAQYESIANSFIEWVGSFSSVVVHTILFIGAFTLGLFGIGWNKILLVLTTAVSLEAIYLAIFIQMTVNKNTISLAEVGEDIDEIQLDVDEIQEDIDEIQEDIDEIQEDVDEMTEDEKEEHLKELASAEALLRIEKALLLTQKQIAILKNEREKK